MMSKYKTEEQKSAFGVGLIVMLILQGGFDLCKIEGWGPYVGMPMIIFFFIYTYQYTADGLKNKEDE